MFSVKDCNRGSSLCYILTITNILKHFCIGVPNLQYISPGQAQEFNKSTMTHMGYHWYNYLKVYFNKIKGPSKVIYNYDDPDEFRTTNVEEQYVEDQAHHVDTNMDDTHHDDDCAWLYDTEKHEEP